MAILKIRDNEGVITNIAAIKGENGKSPIIKNGTWWIYDDDKKEYVDTGLGAEKETILTKDNIEAVLTGTITSHNHDNVYVKEAPSDSKQYVRYNGEWASIDFSSADFATKEELNTKVDKVEGKVLSTNDYTTEEKNKLAGIAEGAQVNVIEGIQVDGVDVAVGEGKKVNITGLATAANLNAAVKRIAAIEDQEAG